MLRVVLFDAHDRRLRNDRDGDPAAAAENLWRQGSVVYVVVAGEHPEPVERIALRDRTLRPQVFEVLAGVLGDLGVGWAERSSELRSLDCFSHDDPPLILGVWGPSSRRAVVG